MSTSTTRLRPIEPVKTTHLFRPLARELVNLLRGLDPEDWSRPTQAGTWKVREVAAHLLHGDLQELSASRLDDEPDGPAPSFAELVDLIDADNARGVEFLSGLPPSVLVDLLEVTSRQVAVLFASLPPDGRATTNVAWANETVSANWTDVGREYTERWHHQMQIREAVGRQGL